MVYVEMGLCFICIHVYMCVSVFMYLCVYVCMYVSEDRWHGMEMRVLP